MQTRFTAGELHGKTHHISPNFMYLMRLTTELSVDQIFHLFLLQPLPLRTHGETTNSSVWLVLGTSMEQHPKHLIKDGNSNMHSNLHATNIRDPMGRQEIRPTQTSHTARTTDRELNYLHRRLRREQEEHHEGPRAQILIDHLRLRLQQILVHLSRLEIPDHRLKFSRLFCERRPVCMNRTRLVRLLWRLGSSGGSWLWSMVTFQDSNFKLGFMLVLLGKLILG
mmetsp:Transcript_12028/g.24844  ORF Transcript_12028/g.24844 Transcript_12028/m.24844 type:complete len:224 (+) Transcript_12028:71-742(+)